MKKYYLAYLLFSFVISFSQKIKSQSDYCFYENKGQIIDQNGKSNSGVKYLFNSAGLNVQLKKGGFSYDVYEVEKTKKKISKTEKTVLESNQERKIQEFDYKYKFHRVDIELLNSNKNAEILAEGISTDYENYYNIPNKPEGVTHVHRYQKVTYKNIYPNVDLVFFKPKDSTKTVEYNFIINPGAKISDIKLKFKGAKTKLKDGKLSMNLRFGEMQENIPHSWTEETNSKSDISVKFKEIETGVFGFEAPQDSYDKTVVIDPVPTRIWGSFLGGNGEEGAYVKTDLNNNVYAFGTTNSTNNIATIGAYQTFLVGNLDSFVNKITKDGIKLWGSYYGFKFYDTFRDITFDEDFNVYLIGVSKIPKVGFENNPLYANQQVTIVQFKVDGTLISDKNFGGDGKEESYGISYGNNKIYICGETLSNNYPTLNAFQPSKNSPSGYTDGFLTCLDKNNNFLWSTYIGGTDGSTTLFTIFSSQNDIDILGATRSNKISMLNPFQGNNAGSTDMLYLKFDTNGIMLKSSYLGLDGFDYSFHAIIKNNILIIPGKSETPLQNNSNNLAACVFKVNLITNDIQNKFFIFPYDVQLTEYVDKNANIYFSALADSWNLYTPSPNAYSTIKAGSIFVKYDDNDNFQWGTYYHGGTQLSYITKDNEGFLYFSGMVSSAKYGIATPGTFQQTSGAPSNDFYIAKFADCESNVNVSYDPICNGNDLKLKASGGNTYEWFGPNNFHSYLQNPIIPNAQFSNSGEYFVKITGSQNCNGIFSLIVNVGSPSPPIPDVDPLPDINAVCKVTLTTPTATDGCGNRITATTNNPAQFFSPGIYNVTWNYTDGNGNITTQNQKVIITSPALPVAKSPQVFCAINNPKISDISITAQNPIWYDALGTVINSSTPLIDGNTYYVTQTINGCESNKLPIAVTVHNTQLPTGNQNQDFCSSRNAQIKDLAVTGTLLKFYDNLGNVLNQNTVLQNNTSYYVTQTLNNCESAKFEIKVTLTANSLPANNYNLAFCNDTTENTKTEDLRNYQENIITGSSTYSFDYFDQNNNQISDFANRSLQLGFNTFNVKVKSSDGCWKMVQLILQLNPKPVVNLPADKEICNGVSIELNAGSGFKHYDWTKDDNPTVFSNDEKISVTSVGKYTVEVTNNSNCKNSSSTIVTQAILAQILKVEIINNNIKVLLSASGNFEYSLDNINWQSSNEFSNLSNGNYTVYVKTKLGCIIGNMNFSIFSIPNAFTPNNDGINDTWKIDGLEVYPNSEITVYDKYGTKVFYTKTNGTFEWDGTLDQRKLPTGTYWYILKIGDGRLFQGYLLIKNRN